MRSTVDCTWLLPLDLVQVCSCWSLCSPSGRACLWHCVCVRCLTMAVHRVVDDGDLSLRSGGGGSRHGGSGGGCGGGDGGRLGLRSAGAAVERRVGGGRNQSVGGDEDRRAVKQSATAKAKRSLHESNSASGECACRPSSVSGRVSHCEEVCGGARKSTVGCSCSGVSVFVFDSHLPDVCAGVVASSHRVGPTRRARWARSSPSLPVPVRLADGPHKRARAITTEHHRRA